MRKIKRLFILAVGVVLVSLTGCKGAWLDPAYLRPYNMPMPTVTKTWVPNLGTINEIGPADFLTPR